MLTIWKYELSPHCKLSLPTGAKLLKVANVDEQLYGWFELETNNLNETRNFIVFGTGHRVDMFNKMVYIDTVLFDGGKLVLHVYEYFV